MILFEQRNPRDWPDAWRDDQDPDRRHGLPTGWKAEHAQLVLTPEGSTGGVLLLRLAEDVVSSPAVPSGVRVRVRWRTAGLAADGLWRDAVRDGAGTLAVSLSLSVTEAGVAAAAIEAALDGIAEVDVASTYRGLVPTMPWTVQVDRDALAGHLSQTTGSREEVVLAFTALEGLEAGLTLSPGAGAQQSHSAVLHEVGQRLIGTLFVEDGGVWRWNPGGDVPLQWALDLRMARSEARTRVLTWSLTDHLAALSAEDRAASVLRAAPPGLLERVRVVVVRDVPLEAGQLSVLKVKVRVPKVEGGSEVLQVAWPEDDEVVGFDVDRRSGELFRMDVELLGFLTPVGGAPSAVRKVFSLQDETTLIVDPVRLDVRFVELAVEAEVFAEIDAVDAEIWSEGRQVGADRLDAARAQASVALPGVAPLAPLEVRWRLGDLVLSPETLVRTACLTRAGLLPVHPRVVHLARGDDGARWLAVEVEDGEGTWMCTLDPNMSVEARRLGRSILTEPEVRVRVHGLADDGGVVVGPWTDVVGDRVDVTQPVNG